MKSQEIVANYINIWLNRDETIIPRLFAEDIVYTEFMGSVYQGIEQIRHWFSDWCKVGRVLKWDIQKTLETENTIVVLWYFESEYEKNTDGFNGVSVIVVNDENNIISVNEYYAKANLFYPYGKISG